MPFQWRNQFWQSLKEGAGKRCSEFGQLCAGHARRFGVLAEFGRCRKAMFGVSVPDSCAEIKSAPLVA